MYLHVYKYMFVYVCAYMCGLYVFSSFLDFILHITYTSTIVLIVSMFDFRPPVGLNILYIYMCV